MSQDFSIPSHTRFFAGYLDAVGRQYSDEAHLCALSVNLMPAQHLEHLSIASVAPVENLPGEVERSISEFLGADPRNRLVFYLIEYFDWYHELSQSCVCEIVQLSGEGLPEKHIAYRLFIDNKYVVLFLGYWKDKERLA